MQKEELKSLATDMYDNLIDSIDEQDEASVRQLINYLQSSIEAMKSINDDDVTTLKDAKETFSNAYKDIATDGLLNYKITNGKFLEISNEHSELIDACNTNQINLGVMTDKFKDIQSDMEHEVKKANKIISSLTHQVQKLEMKSNVDSLTKVFNRRAMTRYLNDLCENGYSNYKVSMLMLDLDDFKQINDKHGHLAGDKVLIFITKILKQTLRDGDKVFRYGGEEFIIILNRIDDEFCVKIANRILELIRVNNLIYKGTTIDVTASIGTTMFIDGDTQDSFIARADKALYAAKENGKDQIYTAMD